MTHPNSVIYFFLYVTTLGVCHFPFHFILSAFFGVCSLCSFHPHSISPLYHFHIFLPYQLKIPIQTNTISTNWVILRSAGAWTCVSLEYFPLCITIYYVLRYRLLDGNCKNYDVPFTSKKLICSIEQEQMEWRKR